MVEQTKWQVKSNGINFIVFDPGDDFRTVAECRNNEDAQMICDMRNDALDACNEAWNAFHNGKRKHHRDVISGKCILGCQACAIEKLRMVLNRARLRQCCTQEIVKHYESELRSEMVPDGLVKCEKCGWNHETSDKCVSGKEAV